MTREESPVRVDPLPDPFVVPADVAAASPLHRRVLVRTGAAGADPNGDALARAVRKPWDSFQVTADVGLPGMVSAQEFLAAIRRLADDLLMADAPADPVVVATSAGIHPDDLVLLRALYPDAVVDPSPAETALRFSSTSAGRPAPPAYESPLVDRLIVVVGAGRSGTTWLEQLLLAHPRVGGVPRWESWIFEQLQPLWETYGDRGEPFVAALRRYCDSVFAATLARHSPGADHMVEKTPMHSYHLRRISAVYPDAHVVHLVRDGRDVARSMSRVPFFKIPDVGDAAALWARAIASIREVQGEVPHFRDVRYEALYADPVRTAADILAWAGLGVDERTRTSIGAAAADRVSAHAGTDTAVGPGSWRSLGRAELAAVYRRAGTTLRAEGYAGRGEVLAGRLRGLGRSAAGSAA